MSFYGSIYYQATDAIAKIIVKNSGLNNQEFLGTELPDFVQLDADGRSSELRLDSGNRWIRLEGVDEENRCSFYHSEPDLSTKVCIPGISPDSIEVPEVDEDEKSIINPESETVLNVEQGVRFSMPIIYYDKAGHIAIPDSDADEGLAYQQTFVIPKISSATEIDSLKNRLEIHEEVIGINKDGEGTGVEGTILNRLADVETTKQQVDEFLGENGTWPNFQKNYNAWKGNVDEFITTTNVNIASIDEALRQLSNRVGNLEGL